VRQAATGSHTFEIFLYRSLPIAAQVVKHLAVRRSSGGAPSRDGSSEGDGERPGTASSVVSTLDGQIIGTPELVAEVQQVRRGGGGGGRRGVVVMMAGVWRWYVS
jgi:hypothetical protein